MNVFFVDEKILVCCLKPGDQAVLTDIKLRGYDIISSPRAKNKKEGGGTFLCNNHYQYKEVKASNFYFEILELVFFRKNLIVGLLTIDRKGVLCKLDMYILF